jgi:serine-type D-Ala-D-Ala carboxypeptidase/endopeptidase
MLRGVSRALRASFLALAACSGGSHPAQIKHVAPPVSDADPDGPHRNDIVTQVQPYLDAELADSIVVAIYDGGKREIYGLARPGSLPPNGKTLFELGGVTRVFTGLLFADGLERKEVTLDTTLAETMPPGVAVPTVDNQTITLRDLALNSSGLPREPLRVQPEAADPYAHYDEDALYADLVSARLTRPPGTAIIQSNWGYGLLGVGLGRKLDGGGGYAKLVRERLLGPLELHDTFVGIPDVASVRLVRGTDEDLQPAAAWHWGAMAAAGGMIADARDLLKLIEVELDAADGSQKPLRAAMHFTQAPALDRRGANFGLGWQIDETGRYWQSGTTRGCHVFISFDAHDHRGVVVLAATGLSAPLDHIPDALYAVMANQSTPAPAFPTIDQLRPIVGTYDLSGAHLQVTLRGKRVYLAGPGEPPMRLAPLNDRELWLEALQSGVAFERAGDAIKAMVFMSNGAQRSAARIADSPGTPPATPAPAPTPEPAPPPPAKP